MFQSITIEYYIDACDTTTTYYSFDNSKGEYYCYVMKDEDIPITKEWIAAFNEYYERSTTKIVISNAGCY